MKLFKSPYKVSTLNCQWSIAFSVGSEADKLFHDLVNQPQSKKVIRFKGLGLPSTIRTCDLRLRRAVLYPAELWAVFDKS
jgi:hypothetical protein